MKEKLLLTGSSGMLGSNISLELKDSYEITGVYRNSVSDELKDQYKLDLRDPAEVKTLASKIKPDLIVHCAAMTDVERCEDDYSSARETNALTVKNLLTAFGPGKRFVYISTDSVFDGRSGNYSETDLPSPLNNYAKTKLEGEWFTEQGSNNYVIIRTNIFGWNRIEGESFAEWVHNNLKSGKPVKMFTDVLFSPIYANTLARYIGVLSRSAFTGRINIGANSPVSKFDFGLLLCGAFGFDASLITPVSIDSFSFKARRPKNTSLDISKAKQLLGEMPSVTEGVNGFFKSKERLGKCALKE